LEERPAARTMLTVDWDFFVPEKAEWDWGHKEQPIFLSAIWALRVMGFYAQGLDARQEVRSSGQERTFWSQVRNRFDLNTVKAVLVTESHADAYHAAKLWQVGSVYNFDAHADLGYHGIANLQLSAGDDPTCEDWLGRLVLDGVRAVVAYPAHSLEHEFDNQRFSQLQTMTGRAQLTLASTILAGVRTPIPVTVLHLCRSGAWTPPWLDGRFLMLAMSSGASVKPDVRLTDRSKVIDWRAMEKAGREQHKLFDDLRNRLTKGEPAK